jgi:hypothetical protein
LDSVPWGDEPYSPAKVQAESEAAVQDGGSQDEGKPDNEKPAKGDKNKSGETTAALESVERAPSVEAVKGKRPFGRPTRPGKAASINKYLGL